jgi:hypothetical protein
MTHKWKPIWEHINNPTYTQCSVCGVVRESTLNESRTCDQIKADRVARRLTGETLSSDTIIFSPIKNINWERFEGDV